MTAEERESYAQNGTLPAWFRGTVGSTGSDSQEYSLKTETMLVDAARECGNPNLRAIIFRQQFTQMTDIIDKTHRLYKAMGATYVGPPSWTWTFPSGAKIRLA